MKFLRRLFSRNKPLPAPDRSVAPKTWRYYTSNWTAGVGRAYRV